jgi:hypothetical protein
MLFPPPQDQAKEIASDPWGMFMQSAGACRLLPALDRW